MPEIIKVDGTWYRGKYLNFHDLGPIKPGKPTRVYDVKDRMSSKRLGSVKWYAQWRKYLFFPLNSIFDQHCLLEVAGFLEDRTAEIKATWGKKKKKRVAGLKPAGGGAGLSPLPNVHVSEEK